MDSSKKASNKISDIVRLRQILKKWKKAAHASSSSSSSSSSFSGSKNGSAPIKFIKRTLSFTDINSNNVNNNDVVPKGFLAVCVGIEEKRYVIPTEYLRHQAFGILLREAEEEFGFQQQGVLKIPCPVPVFEKILYLLQHNKDSPHGDVDPVCNNHSLCLDFTSSLVLDNSRSSSTCCSPHPQLCR